MAESPMRRELATLAADYRLGAVVNAIDEVAKRHGGDTLPTATYKAAMALWSMLSDLDLVDAGSPRAADVWRSL